MLSANDSSNAKHRCDDPVARCTCTLSRGRSAGGGHLGHSDWLSIGVEVCRGALDQGRDGAVGAMREDGRCRRCLGAVAVAGRGRGASAGGRSQLVDIGEAGKARDPVGALGFEAALGGMLLMAGVMCCRSGVTAVTVLNGGSGESREGGRCRGGGAAGEIITSVLIILRTHRTWQGSRDLSSSVWGSGSSSRHL